MTGTFSSLRAWINITATFSAGRAGHVIWTTAPRRPIVDHFTGYETTYQLLPEPRLWHNQYNVFPAERLNGVDEWWWDEL